MSAMGKTTKPVSISGRLGKPHRSTPLILAPLLAEQMQQRLKKTSDIRAAVYHPDGYPKAGDFGNPSDVTASLPTPERTQGKAYRAF